MTSTLSAQRFLIVRRRALSDVCRSVALITSLRKAYPHGRVDWVVQDSFASAIEHHPDLSHAIRLPKGRFERWLRDPRAICDILRWVRNVRSVSYDVVIDADGHTCSGLLTRATGAPMRIGHADARAFARLAYTHRVGPSKRPNVQTSNVRRPTRRRGNEATKRLSATDQGHFVAPLHAVDRVLALLEPIGVTPVRDLRLYVPPDALAWWDAELDQRNMLGERYVVFAPTARWPSKRWPIERWRELVRPLLMRGFDRIIILGAPGEEEQARPLTELAAHGDDADAALASPLLDFVGRTTIAQTMAVIARASFVLANDAAPLHMAVGFDRPCVGLFGPTDPAVFGPYGRPYAALRAFRPKPGEIMDYHDRKLGNRLMRVISSAAVVQQIDRVLQRESVDTGSPADAAGEIAAQQAVDNHAEDDEVAQTVRCPATDEGGKRSLECDGGAT